MECSPLQTKRRSRSACMAFGIGGSQTNSLRYRYLSSQVGINKHVQSSEYQYQ